MAQRGIFQIHLSTAIVLMIVASGMLWSNLEPRDWRYVKQIELDEQGNLDPSTKVYGTLPEYGWPRRVRYYEDPDYIGECEPRPSTGWPGRTRVILERGPSQFSVYGLVLNILTALALLAAVAFACEWRIRRRDAR